MLQVPEGRRPYMVPKMTSAVGTWIGDEMPAFCEIVTGRYDPEPWFDPDRGFHDRYVWRGWSDGSTDVEDRSSAAGLLRIQYDLARLERRAILASVFPEMDAEWRTSPDSMRWTPDDADKEMAKWDAILHPNR
jgi:hypothetical protein